LAGFERQTKWEAILANWKISLGARALGLGAALLSAGAMAQQASDQSLERIEITGSSIRRIEAEGALPVTVISRDTIDKSGVTSVTDLIQSLPAMTGGNFQQSSSSVNGNATGETTAAIHGLDQKYTLVLLNGRRVAPFGGFGSLGADGSVNLESIPLDAIERVEVLTDGASALYGSDAIAGVINFITKKNTREGTAFFNMSEPKQSGGSTWSAGISKGFGDLTTDGYNILATYSHDYQEKLMASQREISKRGGLIPFTINGQNVIFDQTSGNSLPGTIFLDQSGAAFSPYFNKNGNCGSNPAVFVSGGLCRTNYAATVEDIPGSSRDSLFLSGRYRLNPETSLFAEAVYSKFDMKASFAPPAQPMGLGTSDLPGQPLNILWQKYVVPYLTANNDPSTSGTMAYRAFEAGGRTDDWVTTAKHFVLGADGTFQGWDYSGSLTLSSNVDDDNLAGGYMDFTKFVSLISSGVYDPLIPIAGQSLSSAVLGGTFLSTTVNQNVLNLRASKDMFAMEGGNASLGVGVDYTALHVQQNPNALASFGNLTPGQVGNTDYAVGGFYGYMPMDGKRNNYGAFAELLMPVTKRMEATASLRFDQYDKVHSDAVYAQAPDPVSGLINPQGSADEGNSFNHFTFKLSFRAQPTDSVLLRGSYGSGFKAPSIPQIASNVAFSTNTSGSYVCPFLSNPACKPYQTGTYQWDLLTDGNPFSGGAGLKAETSRQWTFGGRWEPIKALSMGLDLWGVKLNNQILAGIPENLAFTNPTAYQSFFVIPYRDPSGPITVALKQIPFNAGQSETEGLDYDFTLRWGTAVGPLTADLSGTHMLKSRYQLLGGWQSDLGTFGADNNVVFRDLARLIFSLETGAFTNTLTLNYKSGYTDQGFQASDGVVNILNPDGSEGAGVAYQGHVAAYKIYNWQLRYQLNKAWRFTVGINNIFDTPPPVSLKLVGGNQVGYDGRYADPTGRAYVLGALFRF
jgi:iron complex outermembrane recepter protein